MAKTKGFCVGMVSSVQWWCAWLPGCSSSVQRCAWLPGYSCYEFRFHRYLCLWGATEQKVIRKACNQKPARKKKTESLLMRKEHVVTPQVWQLHMFGSGLFVRLVVGGIAFVQYNSWLRWSIDVLLFLDMMSEELL